MRRPIRSPLHFDNRRNFADRGASDYAARVLGNLARRAIDLAVLLLALYAFAFVPLGRRTGLEHLRAILKTPASRDAGHEVTQAAERLRDRLLGADAPGRAVPPPAHGAPTVPELRPGRAPPEMAAVPAPPGDAPDASL